MIAPLRVFLAVDPLDMRWGIERLSCHVQHALGRSPCEGAAFGFTNRDHTRLKLLIWDGTGVWLCQRRLLQGRFVWPKPGDTLCALTAEQWQWLTKGVDWQRLSAEPPGNWQV
ncbi:MAG: IS66 family insertion sequence element accessory protein TnpB [Paludibacterium sp.]|uniref:IS66 family insertion sequence element accessory protein TnpB n=1 Tax=Paludibacterium sp. TaxID=1917523 RepID=UPI0025EC25D6|nr:IS66 family insertion sequence element accessory protein TnpB [Paludibacterium sp.]MBV8047886.1 IS66 family insertion sequence element accessory protein TnpB [Paludibacterium sp.]MBV8649805.1 IS66 family insertion sequence element accessory protein TnpB [Paludibacterium sp.]